MHEYDDVAFFVLSRFYWYINSFLSWVILYFSCFLTKLTKALLLLLCKVSAYLVWYIGVSSYFVFFSLMTTYTCIFITSVCKWYFSLVKDSFSFTICCFSFSSSQNPCDVRCPYLGCSTAVLFIYFFISGEFLTICAMSALADCSFVDEGKHLAK